MKIKIKFYIITYQKNFTTSLRLCKVLLSMGIVPNDRFLERRTTVATQDTILLSRFQIELARAETLKATDKLIVPADTKLVLGLDRVVSV